MLQTYFKSHNDYFFTLNIRFRGTTRIATKTVFIDSVGANVLAKKSKIVVSVRLKIVRSNTLPTDRIVTNTMKLKIIVNVVGYTCSNKAYIIKTISGNNIKLIPITL